ncbi:hypothetical protein ECANGB1_2608 [Enterospora canceri]|uniref:Uncharacterized protein n=1 Tax=Enterospora canceri TaxID=1081671 RepID=A0A1Y1S9N2_9MICR|nr:hypothetical protein ECANGB1_2608 [Enterospora canceri]
MISFCLLICSFLVFNSWNILSYTSSFTIQMGIHQISLTKLPADFSFSLCSFDFLLSFYPISTECA